MVSLHLAGGAFDGTSPASRALAQLLGHLQARAHAPAGHPQVPGLQLAGLHVHVEDALQVSTSNQFLPIKLHSTLQW